MIFLLLFSYRYFPFTISLPLFSYRYLPTAIGCSTVAHAWPALHSLLSSILGHLSFLPAYKVPLLPLTPALHLPLFSYRFYFPTALFFLQEGGKVKTSVPKSKH